MMRLGSSFGPLDYETSCIPTMGAGNSPPHEEPIRRVEAAKQAYLKRLSLRSRLWGFFQKTR